MQHQITYPVNSKPPLALSMVLAFQHLLAALGSIIAVPLLIGNLLKLPTADTIILVQAAVLVSGVVTIIQCRGVGIVGIRLPVVMGTSFTFVATALSIGFTEHGIAGIMGSALVGSLVMIIGSFFMPYIRQLFPPVVTGVVVMMIGISLIPVGVDWFAGGQVSDSHYAEPQNLAMAAFVLTVVICLTQWGQGFLSAAAIVIGMLVGYVFCLTLGWVNFDALKEVPVFAVPQPFHFGLSFPISGIIGMSMAYLVTIVESNGDFLALSGVTQTELTGERLRSGILCDGLGSAFAAVMSTTPFSSFSQNIGVVSLTGVASRFVVALTGCLLIIAGLFPAFGALIVSIPLPVLGGAGLIMFAMIIAVGVQILESVEHSKRNTLIIALSIGCGLAVTTRPELLSKMPDFVREIFSSGITVGSLMALILNLILPKEK